MRRLAHVWLVLLAGWIAPAHGVQPDEILSDPALEARARAISTELRCLVCQNQSIDDSDAALARDLRLLVRERLQAGDSDETVLDYVVARYGEFVLLKPRWNARNLALWATPMVLLLIGGTAVWMAAHARRPEPRGRLTADERARLDAIMNDRS